MRSNWHVAISLHHTYKSNLKWWKSQIKEFAATVVEGGGGFLWVVTDQMI